MPITLALSDDCPFLGSTLHIYWTSHSNYADVELQMVDCSHEMKRRLLLGRKVYDQPRQHIKKQRHTLPTKVHLVKAMVFAVVMRSEEHTSGTPSHL